MSVYKRGDVWWYSLCYKGFRERKAVGSSKGQAVDVLAKRQIELREQKFFNITYIKKIRFEEFIPEYLKYSEMHKRSHARDRTSVKPLSEFFTGMQLDKITPADIMQYAQKRKMMRTKTRGTVVTNTTVNLELFMLSAIFKLAITLQYVMVNPVKAVKKLKVESRAVNFLTRPEIESLLKVSDGYLRSIMLVAIHTGMRKTEIFQMRWKDVDLENRTIQLPQTKNGKSRVIYMTEEVRLLLASETKMFGSEFVFHNADGRPFIYLQRSFHTALRKARIDRPFRFHDLRHTFASHAAMSGVDLITLKEMLGQ